MPLALEMYQEILKSSENISTCNVQLFSPKSIYNYICGCEVCRNAFLKQKLAKKRQQFLLFFWPAS